MTEQLNPALPVSAREIIRVVAADYGVSERQVYGSGRAAEVAEARQLVCWIACDVVGMASAVVAQVILRDSSAVRHAARAISHRREADDEFRVRTDRLADDVARRGYTALSAMLADPDPVAAAARIARNPLHEAMRVSTLEVAAMALRLIELEHVAAATFQLLSSGRDAAGDASLTEAITEGLAALGYETTEEEAPATENLNVS